MEQKKIAVIGAGLSGIATTVALKEDPSFEPICFEKTDRHAGTFGFRETSEDGVPSCMTTTVINHSKEMGAYSTFPPRKEFNNYMRHKEIYEYLTEYAESKDALRHIRYNSEVTEVKKSHDYDLSGRWIVSVKDTLTAQVTTDIYDGVMVCIGHVNRPKMPSYPGEDVFKGKIMHTHSLKETSEFKGKNVVVVGMGCSGLDAAVESSSVANQVYLSTRSGGHIINRQGPHGYPTDYLFFRRYLVTLIDYFPIDLLSWFLEILLTDAQFDQKLYAVKPSHHVLSKDPYANDNIGSKLLSGAVIQKRDIARFTEEGVVFEGDTDVTDADVVIMGTGYTWKFPFLEDGIVVKDEGRINLYKLMYPPHLPHATLAILGFFIPYGPGFPMTEMQARWATYLLGGKGRLPSKRVMMKDIRDRYSENSKRFGYSSSEKTSIRADYVQYLDEIATQFGAKPNFFKIFLTDIKLFRKLLFGPSLPYQYRLQGPHPWEGAREAIMGCEQRVLWPLTKRDSHEKDSIFMRLLKKVIQFFVSYY